MSLMDTRKEGMVEELVKGLIEDVETGKQRERELKEKYERDIEEKEEEWWKENQRLLLEIETLRLGQHARLIEQEISGMLTGSQFQSVPCPMLASRQRACIS